MQVTSRASRRRLHLLCSHAMLTILLRMHVNQFALDLPKVQKCLYLMPRYKHWSHWEGLGVCISTLYENVGLLIRPNLHRIVRVGWGGVVLVVQHYQQCRSLKF